MLAGRQADQGSALVEDVGWSSGLASGLHSSTRRSLAGVCCTAVFIGGGSQYLSVQSMLFNGSRAVPLALLLLYELRHGPNAGLDERNLPHVGRCARRLDHHYGQLVPGIFAIKLMMDRLVCADGGSPDPTRTEGKDAALAKQIELEGWPYEQHLKGRLFSVVVHGDVEGAENVRRSLADWLRCIGLRSAGASGEIDRYIGYWKPYATSHAELDQDNAVQEEVRNVARTLLEAVLAQRIGTMTTAGAALEPPRQK